MKILSLHDKHNPTPRLKAEMLADCGVTVLDHSPTLFSAFAAMRISSIIDREDIPVIVTEKLKDAMTAISARRLARKKDVKVVMNVPANTRPPKGIPGDIRNNVDAWIFPSIRMRDAFPPGLNNARVIAPTSFEYPTDIPMPTHDVPVVAWVGKINRPDRLKMFLDEAEAAAGDFKLRISGAGDAAKVMPVVRLSRSLSINDDIIWVGEGYDTVTEIAAADALLASDDDITEAEAAAALSGRPVLHPGQLTTWLHSGSTPPSPAITPAEALTKFHELLERLERLE